MINETLNNASCILKKKKAKISVIELLKTVGRSSEVDTNILVWMPKRHFKFNIYKVESL